MGSISVVFLLNLLLMFFYFLVAIFVVIFLYLLFTYLFESMALWNMLKKKRYRAYIPIYQKYLLGSIIEKKNIGITLAILELFLLLLGIFLYFHYQSFYFFLFLFLLSLHFVFINYLSNQIFQKSAKKYASLLTTLSILSFGFLRVIFLFWLSNRREFGR